MRVEGHHRLPSIRAEVFDVMGFVQDHVVPLTSFEGVDISQDQLIARDAYVECILLQPTYAFLLPFILIAIVSQYFEARTKLLELHLPIEDDARGYHNQVRTPNLMLNSQMC